MQQRNNAIDIAKGIAITLMVVAHAEMPTMLNRAIYLFHMPLFFITAGWFFSLSAVENPWNFVVRRFKGLYVPFLKWSLFFLLIHNLLFKVGILNEVYGNWSGGVTHPYSLHQFWRRAVDIVFSMGGYDEFLAGAFWFFRALLVASIAFLVLFLLFGKIKRFASNPIATAAAIAVAAVAFALFKVGEGLSVRTLVQGGYRDAMGLFFFAAGFIYRRYEDKIGHSLWLAALGLVVVLVGAWSECAGMTLSPRVRDVLTLPLTGLAGWVMTYNLSYHIDKSYGKISSLLSYCGRNSLYILIWHISAFKLVSLVKIGYYGLDIRQIGCHMVVHDYAADDCFWLLYTVAGVGMPMLGCLIVDKLKNRKTAAILKK